MKAYWPGKIETKLVESLRDKTEGIEIITDQNRSLNSDYQILISGVPEEKHIAGNRRLKALIIPWAGLPKKTGELMMKYPDIAVHNLHHNAVPVAEAALALLLAAARKLIPVDRNFRANDWTDRYAENETILLNGKTALILGAGAIGSRIASLCNGLGVKAILVGRSARENGSQTVRSKNEIPQLLPKANILFVALPATKDTNRLIGVKELSLLPDNATVINIARGSVVNEAALYNELKSGRIRAGLDVWYQYPEDQNSRRSTAPAKFPFSDLDNVVMTPHMGGHSDQTDRLRVEHLAKILNLAAQGKELPNRVDLEKGY